MGLSCFNDHWMEQWPRQLHHTSMRQLLHATQPLTFETGMFRLSFLRSMIGDVFRLLQKTPSLFFQSVLAACAFGTLPKEGAIGC